MGLAFRPVATTTRVAWSPATAPTATWTNPGVVPAWATGTASQVGWVPKASGHRAEINHGGDMLRKNFVDNAGGLDTGQLEIETLMAISKSLVVNTTQVQ